MIKPWLLFPADRSPRNATTMDVDRQQSKIRIKQSDIRWIVYFLLLIFDF